MNVFITGFESFIGRVVAEQCRCRGWAISGVDCVQPTVAGGQMADILSPDLADCIPQNVDAVIHLAAVSRDTDCRQDVGKAYETNVVGTARVAEAAKLRGAKQVVFASSEWVYGDAANAAVQQEDDPIDIQGALSEYALSKMSGEQLLRIAHRGGWFDALTVLRFGIVYGPRPRNWSAVESIFYDICCQREVKIGSRATARRFIHVDDVSGGILAACEQRSDVARTYNLSGNELVSLGDIAEAAFEILGYDVPVVETNPEVVSIRNPVNDLIRKELQWQPSVTLRDGLQDLHSYFEQEQLIQCTA